MGVLKGKLWLLAGLTVGTASGQELNCRVEFNVDQVEVSVRPTVESLQSIVSDYMNTTSFTDKSFSPQEKIDCRLFVAVKSCVENNFTVDLHVQSSRPVYNSTYTTQLVNFKEKDLKFTYNTGESLIFSHVSTDSQLTSVLDFYAYLILAMDFDSFSRRGGEEYFRQLDRIVQIGQSSGVKGWRQYDSPTSRGAILSAWTNTATSSLRDLNYSYHREGLDVMSANQEIGRRMISESLIKVLSDVHDVNPMSVGLTMWRDAKLDETVSIYVHDATEGKQMANLLKEIFPSDIETINRIEHR